MTEVWFEHRLVSKLVIRSVDKENAMELEMVFSDGKNKTMWLLRGEC